MFFGLFGFSLLKGVKTAKAHVKMQIFYVESDENLINVLKKFG